MKQILIVVSSLLALFSCGSNPSGTGGEQDPESDFDVYLPDENSVWQLWQTEVLVEYDHLAITQSTHVKIDLVRGDSLVVQLSDWFLNNSGSYSASDQVPDSFGVGDDYRIMIYTPEGDTAYSAQFTIDGYDLGGFSEVPAGSFAMGSEEGEWYHQPGESPLHTVTFASSFEMMCTEVRQLTWSNVMSTNPSSSQGDSLPVEMVSWTACQEFIQTLNEIDPDYNYRLPSEAEWEYSCRAGSGSSFYWGDDNSTGTVSQYGWYNPNSAGGTHRVGDLIPNLWGLYDMSGNVYEWCQDVHHDTYDGAPSDGSAWETGGNQGHRVQRGGSWSSNAQFLRNATRSSLNESQVSISTGFRLIREPK